MKKVLFVFTLMTGVFVFTSCNNQKKQEAVVEEVTVVTATDKIVKDSISDTKGNKLYLTFNNTKGTVEAVLGGETIIMLQDTTASGIRFNNDKYLYEEWQGKVTLKKDGTIVFESQK